MSNCCRVAFEVNQRGAVLSRFLTFRLMGEAEKKMKEKGRHCVGGKGECLQGQTKVNLIGRAEHQPHEAFFFFPYSHPLRWTGTEKGPFFMPFIYHHRRVSLFLLALFFFSSLSQFLSIYTHTAFYSIKRMKVVTKSIALESFFHGAVTLLIAGCYSRPLYN